jgi:hypothetical protein
VTFWPKSLVFKVIKQIKVFFFWSTNLVYKLIEVNFGLKSSFKYFIFGLESSFKYFCENLKLLMRKPFEHLNQIKQACHVYHVGHVGHADRVGFGNDSNNCGDNNNGNVNRLHVGLINGDSIDYNDESGDKVPFIIL